MTLHLGRWEEALSDVECDALICDPPYGARTHAGHNASAAVYADGSLEIDYSCWTTADVHAFVASWAPRTSGWMVALTSHDLIPAWEDAYASAGRYHFAPVTCLTLGMTVRKTGDGPASWSVYAMVARPKTRKAAKWAALPGGYVCSASGGGGRGKPLDLMRALVKDYSRPGDLICDPCAGFATTGVAALSMGRRFVGAECDPAAHAEGLARLSRVQPLELFAHERATQPKMEL